MEEWCERLQAAVADGRYLEDPGMWEVHLISCEECRRVVEGLTILRGLIDEIDRTTPPPPPGPHRGRQIIEEIFRQQRRRRITLFTVCVVLLGGLAAAVVYRHRGISSPRPPEAIPYAEELYRRVFPPEGPADYELLKENEKLRREYLAALDHPSSLVRRTALHALTYSGIEIEVIRLQNILERWDEDLERPVEIAALGDGARYLHDALAERRVATLRRVLRGLRMQVAQGGALVHWGCVEPYVTHGDTEVRKAALWALECTPDYEPGPLVEARLRSDSSLDVRVAAAACLVTRRGEEGRRFLFAYLRASEDWALESRLLFLLGTEAESEKLSRDRILDVAVPPRLALLHAYHLAQVGALSELPEDLGARALADTDPWTLHALGGVAHLMDLADLRDALQERWERATPGPVRRRVAERLVKWDIEAATESRAHLALTILEVERDEHLRSYLRELTRSPLGSVKERARQLLVTWPEK